MYIRRTDGPIFAVDHQGRRITRADLPPADVTRWVAQRKALVASAVMGGLITRAEACARWDLSEEELEGWCRALVAYGAKSLRTTKLQKYRRAE